MDGRKQEHRVATQHETFAKQVGEATEAQCGMEMLGPEGLLVYRQCALEERPRACKLTLVVQQAAKVDEALRCIGMLGTERFFSYRQRALEERTWHAIVSEP